MSSDDFEPRRRSRKSTAGLYRGVVVEQGPPPAPPSTKRSWIPASLHSDLQPRAKRGIKWAALIAGGISALGAFSAALLKVADALDLIGTSATTEAQIVLLQEETKALREQIYLLKVKDNQLIRSDKSFRRVYGADRKNNVAGSIWVEGVDQDTVRMRNESFCERNKPDCRPTWAFTATVAELPSEHKDVPNERQ